MTLLVGVETRAIYAGTGRFPWSAKPIRMWTVPLDDCVAVPTFEFYRDRVALLTNQGNRVHQRWVALDRSNDVDWAERRFSREVLMGAWDAMLQSGELKALEH